MTSSVSMDDLARDYLVLALSVGELEAGVVDAYYGPAELLAAAREAKTGPAELAEHLAELRTRARQLADGQRARWLDRQALGLETIARRLAGTYLPYVEEVERCFDARPEATPPEEYSRVRRQIEELLPGNGDIRDRLAEHDRELTVPTARLPGILDWLTGELRQSCAEVLPQPEGESLTISLVTDQPWSAYNWYHGGLRSRIEVNTDLPVRAQALIGLLTHEGYPGHHLEHAWKETRLFTEQRRGEASVQLINTPEAYISEGLAEVGGGYVVDQDRWQELFLGICQRAGIRATPADAVREWQLARTRRGLRGVSGDAALLLHAEDRSHDEVVGFLEHYALRTREQAEKDLQFINHPLWRTYVFCYAGGERLLGKWCAAAGDLQAQRARYLRLLTEQLTPSAIAADLP
jgi:hypothetical protein